MSASRLDRIDRVTVALDADTGPVVTLVRADTVTPEPIHWLWPGWLATGKLHIYAGPPGTGKTTVALDLAASLSAGGIWPDGTRAVEAGVVIWSGEDGIEDTLVPRLQAAGARLDKISFISGVTELGHSRPFDPKSDVPELRAAINRLPAKTNLLIVDPIVSAIAGDSHKNAEVRQALQPLVDLAREQGCAVLGITHFSKGMKGREPVERVTGSIAFGAVARVVVGFARLPDEHERGPGRLMVRAKSNIGLDEGGFVYELEQQPLRDTPLILASRVLWRGEIEGSARDLLLQAEAVSDPDERSERNEAADLVRDVLSGGPKPRKQVMKAAREQGLSESTVKRAARQIGVQFRRTGFAGGSNWELPAFSSESQHPEQDSHDLNDDPGLNAAIRRTQRQGDAHSAHSAHQATTEALDLNTLLTEAIFLAGLGPDQISVEDLRANLDENDLGDPEIMNVNWLAKYARTLTPD